MKFTLIGTCLSAALFLFSCATPQPDIASKSGMHHFLVAGSGAQPWHDRRKTKTPFPGGLVWRAPGSPEGIILCLHGVQTHAAWFAPLAKELNAAGWTVIAPDRRGSGANSGEPHRYGDTPNAATLIGDLGSQLSQVTAEARGKPVVLLGTSWGANLAGAYLAEARDRQSDRVRPDGLVLLVPATAPKLKPSTAKTMAILLANAVAPRTLFKLPFDDDHYHAGPDQETSGGGGVPPDESFLSDTLSKDASVLIRRPSARTQAAGAFMGMRWKKNAIAVASETPVLVMTANHDQIMNNEGARKIFDSRDRLFEARKIPGGHGLQLTDPGRITDEFLDWWRSRKR